MPNPAKSGVFDHTDISSRILMRSSIGWWVENKLVNQLCAALPRKGLAA